jgi:hypothetical protein
MESWKQAGIAVYMPKGTTSKETVETRSYGKKLFMVKFLDILGSTKYNVTLRCVRATTDAVEKKY